jgi:Tfp pilus assembly protein PilF
MLQCTAEDPLALFNLGNLAVEDGDLDRARSLYNRAVAADPDYYPAHHGLALVAFTSGRFDDARREAEEALRLAGKGSPIARRTLALLEAIDDAQKNP